MAEVEIDRVEEERSGNVVLTLRHEGSWLDSGEMSTLQHRLNGYIDVITQGELYRKYPDLTGRPVRIRLICFQLPPEAVMPKLDRVTATLSQLGIGFELVQLSVETPTIIRSRLKTKPWWRLW